MILCVYWCFFTFEDFKSWRPVGPRGFLFEARVKIDSSLVSEAYCEFSEQIVFQSFFVIPSPPPPQKKKHRNPGWNQSPRHSEKRAKLSPEEAMDVGMSKNVEVSPTMTGWWFGSFFIVPYIGNMKIDWLVVWNMNFMTFRGVETTNQMKIGILLVNQE